MRTPEGKGARPDGPVRYRHDAQTGRRIGILPATCKRGEHSLAVTGYRAIETGILLQVSCDVCCEKPHPDHAWRLTTTAPPPDAAELDDGAYKGIDPHFVARPIRRR